MLPGGRWRVAPPDLVSQLDAISAGDLSSEPPSEPTLRLVPGRQLRTLNSALRDTPAPGGRTEVPWGWLNPTDAASAGVADGATVEVHSYTGSCTLVIRISDAINAGCLHIPHGWAAPNVSQLTDARHDVDPLTGMPTQSGVPVTIGR